MVQRVQYEVTGREASDQYGVLGHGVELTHLSGEPAAVREPGGDVVQDEVLRPRAAQIDTTA